MHCRLRLGRHRLVDHQSHHLGRVLVPSARSGHHFSCPRPLDLSGPNPRPSPPLATPNSVAPRSTSRLAAPRRQGAYDGAPFDYAQSRQESLLRSWKLGFKQSMTGSLDGRTCRGVGAGDRQSPNWLVHTGGFFSSNRGLLRYRRAAGEFAEGGVTYISEVGDADLAGVEAVAGEAAEEGEEGHALTERGVLLGVFPEGDEVQNFFLLLRGAFHENLAVAVGAEAVQPEESAAEAQLIFFVLAGQQVDEFRSAGFDRAAGFFVLGNNRVAERNERRILRRGEKFRSVLPSRGRGFLLVHHLVDVLGGR